MLVQPFESNTEEMDKSSLASDRDTQHNICQSALAAFMTDSNQAAADCQASRHASPTSVLNWPCCSVCSRICASDFFRRSHL